MLFNNRTSSAMQASMNALWMKQKLITNNIANAETPGFNAKTLDFQEVIGKKLDEASGKAKTVYDFKAIVSEDTISEMRVDGNNVDVDKQEIELWSTYAQFSYLQQLISNDFAGMSYVITNTGK